QLGARLDPNLRHLVLDFVCRERRDRGWVVVDRFGQVGPAGYRKDSGPEEHRASGVGHGASEIYEPPSIPERSRGVQSGRTQAPGISIATLAPPPSRFFAQALPPCAVAILCTRFKPRPCEPSGRSCPLAFR